MRVDDSVNVKKDAVPHIKIMGFLGTKYIDIEPGGVDSKVLSPEVPLHGQSVQDINEVIGKLSKEVDEMVPLVKETVEKVHNAVGKGEEIVMEVAEERKIQKILDNADQSLLRIQDMIKDMNEMIHENSPKVSNTVSNFEDFSGELKTTFHEISPKVKSLVEKMNDVVLQLEAVIQGAKKLVRENKPGVEKIVKNLEEASFHAKKFLEILHHQPWRLLAKPKEQKLADRGFKRSKKFTAPGGYIYRKEE